MKITATFRLGKQVTERLAVHSRITGRTKTQIVERAILRYCGKEKP